MAITVGKKLGAYEVVSLLGKGGMGEVYKGLDTRLNRFVAIKVLPEHVSNNMELKQRFEREAQTLASLSHPHICPVFDVGRQDNVDYIVMEFLEGQTLAQRLDKGVPPLNQALKIGVEIADALDKAHRHGITHRDLKPSNIMLTKSGVKLLDFGLAKLRPVENVSTISTAPTNADVTAQGTILGTLQYMSPEQLEGGDADARTDIFTFGSVLYEMVTGRKAFQGKSQMSVIGAILKDTPPPPSALQPVAPAALDRVIARCLEKDPENRWQSARDLCHELKWLANATQDPAAKSDRIVGRRQLKLVWALAAIAVGIALVGVTAAYLTRRGELQPDAIKKFAIVAPPDVELIVDYLQTIDFSRDAKQLVFVGRRAGIIQLYRRLIDQFETVPIPGTEGGSQPFFSPDGQWIGFFAGGKLKKIAVTGGTPVPLCDVTELHGASWGIDDAIIFSQAGSALLRVSSAGGTPQPVTKLDPNQGETEHHLPEILPGGQALLFTASQGYLQPKIAVYSVKTRQHRILLDGLKPRFVRPGHIVFSRVGGSLWAVPFDPDRLELMGPAVPLVEGVRSEYGVWPYFTIGSDGTLVYVPGSPLKQLVWVDRKGSVQPLGFPARPYESPRLSPDAKRVATTVREENHDVWIYDLDRGTATRVTNAPGEDETPVWIPTGNGLVFAGDRPGASTLLATTLLGSSAEEALLGTAGGHRHADSISADGRLLAFTEISRGTGADIWIMPIREDHKPQPFLQTPFNEWGTKFSPDGRWITYVSDESGRNEVYVQPYPGRDAKWQISTEGGAEPVWSRNGRELFYRNVTRMMVAEIATQPTFSGSKPSVLFEGRYENLSWEPNYDISPDGQRFLMLKSLDNASPNQINVVLNWLEELKRRVPAGTGKSQ